MLLPSNSPNVDFPQEIYHSVADKTRLFVSRCGRSLSPAGDGTLRGKFRFCVCTGSRRNGKKTLTRWYVKVSCWRSRLNLLFLLKYAVSF